LSKDSKHPLAVQLQFLHSEDDITNLLQDRAKALDTVREKDRMLKAIKTTVSVLTPLSGAVSFADAVGLVRQGKLLACSTSLTIFSALPTCESSRVWSRCPARCMCSSLVQKRRYRCNIRMNHWQVSNGVISSFDILADLLESIKSFVGRLKIYTRMSPTPELDEIVVQIIVELISTLALVTKKLGQRRLRESMFTLLTYYFTQNDAVKRVVNFFAVKDIKGAQRRLEKRTKEELWYCVALTAGGVDDLKRMRTEGEQTCSVSNSVYIKYLSL
jgi:hypothetical protein